MLIRIFTPYRTALALAVVALILAVVYKTPLKELLPNIITDLLGIAVAVLVIDTIYRVRSDAELKKVLISKLASKNNTVATEALKEIEARGWLGDGSLSKAFLLSANLEGNSIMGADMRRAHLSFASLRGTSWLESDLQGAFFDFSDLQKAMFTMDSDGHVLQADLSGASLNGANLTGCVVRPDQLARTRTLWRAIMPGGTIYDGRYNLPQDIELFLKVARNPRDAAEWAQFYGVTQAQYLEGQAWAKGNPSLSNPPVSA
jgi:hypothetical protein